MKDEDKDTNDETEETERETETPQRKSGERDIVLEWDDPPFPFKEYKSIAEDDIEFPILMIPTGLGQQLIYNVDDQQTYYTKLPPVWWLYPNTKDSLYGEEYRPDFGALKYSFARLINSRFVGGNVQITDALWLVNDIHDHDSDANSRAYQLTNLGPQPEGVALVKIYQANSLDTLHQYQELFSNCGFKGSILRPLDHMIGDEEFLILNEQ